MDVILKQSGDSVGLYMEKKLTTVLENKTIEQAVEFVKKNLKNINIYIAK